MLKARVTNLIKPCAIPNRVSKISIDGGDSIKRFIVPVIGSSYAIKKSASEEFLCFCKI